MTHPIGYRVQYEGEGYISVKTPFGMMKEHEWIAQQTIGRPLRGQERVHHTNGNKADNRRCNLVICQNERYHKLLHNRMNAKTASGNTDSLHCRFCGEWDTPETMYIGKNQHWHRPCHNRWQNERRARFRRSDRGGAHGDPADAILGLQEKDDEKSD